MQTQFTVLLREQDIQCAYLPNPKHAASSEDRPRITISSESSRAVTQSEGKNLTGRNKKKTEGALLLTGWEATPPMRRGRRAPPRCRRSAPPPPRPPPPPSPAARRPRRCPSPGTTTSCTAPAAAASARSGTGAADPPNAGRRRPCVCGLIDRQQEGEETPSLVVVVGLRRRSDFK